MNTAYDVLGVPRNASDETIKAAFYRTAKACHPDLNAGNRAAEQYLRQAIAAYHILKSRQRRATYDQYLKDSRRERFRRFATPVVAGVMSGSGVALAVWLSVSPVRTPVAFWSQTPGISAAAMVSQHADPRVAAAGESGVRQDEDDGRVNDWGAAALDRPPGDQIASLHPAGGLSEAQEPLAREWEQVQASGDPRAIWAFAVRNPDAPESALARAGLIVLIDAADDVSLLQVLRLVATDAIAERAQERLIRLGALAAAKADSVVSDAPSSSSSSRNPVDEAVRTANREEPAAQPTPRAPRTVAKRQAHTPVRQAASQSGSTPSCSGSQPCSTSASPLFGVGF